MAYLTDEALALSQEEFERLEEEIWKAEHEGQFECPYCGRVAPELRVCCGEVHSKEITVEKCDAKPC